MSEEKKVAPEEHTEENLTDAKVESAEPEAKVETPNEIDKVAELSKKLALAQQTIIDQQESVVRAKADMENVRRRAALDVEKAHKFALDKFADGLLPVIDSLEMAISHADQEDEALKPMIDGVELTLKSLLSTIEKFGLSVIEPIGETFNPEKHQAMSMQSVEGVAANQVIAVMQKGYELNGRLIRPAMVIVAKAPE
ncbi:nucleotide exchange factor GrpE [Psychromonas sp.]|uniref:nucleotide exchange factor GrpE n=1 Tax=Psychromonas sp. TaxID=1884585 RepID=UPI0039E546E2